MSEALVWLVSGAVYELPAAGRCCPTCEWEVDRRRAPGLAARMTRLHRRACPAFGRWVGESFREAIRLCESYAEGVV